MCKNKNNRSCKNVQKKSCCKSQCASNAAGKPSASEQAAAVDLILEARQEERLYGPAANLAGVNEEIDIIDLETFEEIYEGYYGDDYEV